MSDTPQTVTRSQIAAALGAVGVYRVVPFDATYALFAESYLDDFASDFRKWLPRQVTTPKYTPNRFDCDKFAWLARAFAIMRHYACRADESAVAFGFVTYQRQNGGGHAINVAVCRMDATIYPVFWEPQTGRPVLLTEDERASAEVMI